MAYNSWVIRIIQERIMALYSWFLRTDKKPNIKSVRIRKNLLRASESVKYIENYTMWPTAKIKQDAEITLPGYDSLSNNSGNKLSKDQKTILSTKTELAIIKR